MSECKHEFIEYTLSNDMYCKHCEFEPNEEYFTLLKKLTAIETQLQASQQEVERLGKVIKLLLNDVDNNWLDRDFDEEDKDFYNHWINQINEAGK